MIESEKSKFINGLKKIIKIKVKLDMKEESHEEEKAN